MDMLLFDPFPRLQDIPCSPPQPIMRGPRLHKDTKNDKQAWIYNLQIVDWFVTRLSCFE